MIDYVFYLENGDTVEVTARDYMTALRMAEDQDTRVSAGTPVTSALVQA